MSGVKRAQDGRVVRCAEGASDLGVHVEGVLVARMVESAVATRLRVHESRLGAPTPKMGAPPSTPSACAETPTYA